MHNKDKVIFDKNLKYEYNICLYLLEELYNKGVIIVFEFPNYELIVVKCKKGISKDDFRKLIPTTVQK